MYQRVCRSVPTDCTHEDFLEVWIQEARGATLKEHVLQILLAQKLSRIFIPPDIR